MDYSMSYPRSSIFHKVFYANYQFIYIDTTSELYTVNSVCLYTYYTLSAIQIAILMKKILDGQPSLQFTWAKFGSICWL